MVVYEVLVKSLRTAKTCVIIIIVVEVVTLVFNYRS